MAVVVKARDPLKRELKSIRRRAFIDVQLGRNGDDDANQLCHLAGDALKALKNSSKAPGTGKAAS